MDWMQLTIHPQYLSSKMQVRDIKYAFGVEGKGNTGKFIYEVLMAQGLLTKYSERYYIPTDKLLEFAFVPSYYVTSKEQRRALTVSGYFSKEDLITILGGGIRGATLLKAMIRNGYARLDEGRRYRIDQDLGERLVDGAEAIMFVRIWETTPEEIKEESEVVNADSVEVQEEEQESGLLIPRKV